LPKGGPYTNDGADGSLTVIKSFSSARESFLILIDPILGRQGSTWSDTVVRLHGMLFARLQLDSFDDDVDTFFDLWGQSPTTNIQWAQLAVSNLAALYQYNRKDSLLKEALRQGRREKREAEQEEQAAEESTDNDAILPPSQLNDDLQLDMANVDCAPQHFRNMPNTIDDREDVSLSRIVFDKSCHLSFSLLSEALNTGGGSDVTATGPLIHIHIWLVFLAYSLRYQPVVRLLERKVPWQELADLLNDVSSEFSDEEWNMVLESTELMGPELREDTMIRGFEWSRKLFPKDWFGDLSPQDFEESEAENNAIGWRKHRILELAVQITKVFCIL
jgi:hypothetical protein